MKRGSFRDKILFTIFAIILFRIGSIFPVPCIDAEVLKTAIGAMDGTLFGFFNMMSGGGLSQASIFAMGVSPYINASIIIQLLTVAIPALENKKKEGAEGVRKLNRLTRYAAIILSIVQGYGFYAMLFKWNALKYTGVIPAWMIILSFTAGSFLVIWLGEQITKNGMGNGISIILAAGILSGLPGKVLTLSQIEPKYWITVIVLLVFAAMVLVVLMNDAEKRIPVIYARSAAAGNAKQTSNLPLKVNMSGVMPIIFASTILSIPKTIQMFIPAISNHAVASKIIGFFDQTSPMYGLIYLLLIFFFSSFYVSIQYDPVEMANTLKQQGGMIPGLRPGKPTADYLKKSMNRLAFIGALFLGIIAVLPIFLSAVFPDSGFYMGGTSLLIIVGVAIETVKQMETERLAMKYR